MLLIRGILFALLRQYNLFNEGPTIIDNDKAQMTMKTFIEFPTSQIHEKLKGHAKETLDCQTCLDSSFWQIEKINSDPIFND